MFSFFCARFSLLLLEPGEIYFEDFSAYYYPMSGAEAEALRRFVIFSAIAVFTFSLTGVLKDVLGNTSPNLSYNSSFL